MTPDSINMSENDKQVLKDFLDTDEKSKRIEKDKKRLSEEVKKIFEQYGIEEPLDYDGNTFTVTESTRKTLTKAKKDGFIQALAKLGKEYLIIRSLDVDTDTVMAEVENGQLDEAFVKQYMSITPVKTLTVK